MKAMLLAAGLGERMLPLTRLIPKPLIPVLGRPLAVQILHRLADHGFSEAVVNLHHLPDRVRSILGDGTDLGLDQIHYSHEETLLGTGGGVGKAAPHLRGEQIVLVHNSDFLSNIDLPGLVSKHLTSEFPVTLVLAPARAEHTVVDVDGAGRVLSVGGRPEVDPRKVADRHMYTGCHLLDEEVLDRIPSDRSCNIMTDVYPDLIAEGKVGSFVHSGFWWEFGSPADYLDGSLELLGLPPDVLLGVAMTDPIRVVGDATVAVGAGADFHAGVSLEGRIALGLGSMAAEGTVLEDTVVMPEAWVGPGCRLRRVIVAPGTEIPAGLELDEVLVAPDVDPRAEPPAGTRREGNLLVRPLRAHGRP